MSPVQLELSNLMLQQVLSQDEPPLDRQQVFPRSTKVYLLVDDKAARELACGRVPPDVLLQAALAVDSIDEFEP